MDAVRRTLRDLGKTVTGALAAIVGEPQAAVAQTGDQPLPADLEHPVTETVVEPQAADQPVEAGPAPDPVLPDPVLADPVLPDPVLAGAVEVALAAAREAGGAAVGGHLGVEVEGPADAGPVLTHSFATTDPAYVGWRWAVTVARAEGSEHVTIDEVVLLPGADALVAPAWVPWNERLQAGDLSPGDVLPPPADDPRLVPSYAAPPSGSLLDEALLDETFWELGLGRARVLSREGRLDAAERWEAGESGPGSPLAKQAPGRCVDCGFLVPLAGGLRQAFGVCANEFAPDDGRVVALAHGCGAHSETVVEPQHAATAGMAVEDDEFELLPTTTPTTPTTPAAEPEP